MRKKLITFTGGAALLLIHAWSQAATDLPPSAMTIIFLPLTSTRIAILTC